jgi:hypothetical protein
MDRQTALVLTIIFFVLFTTLTYFGAQVTLFSSIVFSVFLSLILLNLFYPVSQLANDTADFTLAIYAVFELVGIALLGIYIAWYTLLDVRPVNNILVAPIAAQI